ncbi:MAG: hypothetical protein HYS81_00015 [Candidatus Aenigmatarchaeota archaeon]|nr:MAG: hypothetical protein HYS81_00015 [Candidatus Aenigmarchaeota archaeon]
MVGLEEIPVCRMCLEPVFYSICTDCLFRDLNRWLEDKAPFIAIEVMEAHDGLTHSFPDSEDNVEMCVRCRETTHNVMCPYCYIREIYHELRMIDEVTAEELLQDFNFDFEGNGYFGELPWSPIGFTHVRASHGTCETCGNDSDRLLEWGGHFMCTGCLEGEEEYWKLAHGG